MWLFRLSTSIQYLTGTKDQVEKAAKAYRVYFSKTEEHNEDEPYLVDHSIVIYLLAPDGDFLDFFTQRTTVSWARKVPPRTRKTWKDERNRSEPPSTHCEGLRRLVRSRGKLWVFTREKNNGDISPREVMELAGNNPGK